MIISLLKVAKQADQCEDQLKLINALERAQNHRANSKTMALITSPKGLSAIFTAGLLKGFMHPSITGQLKKMAVIFGKSNLDDWLKSNNFEEPE